MITNINKNILYTTQYWKYYFDLPSQLQDNRMSAVYNIYWTIKYVQKWEFDSLL